MSRILEVMPVRQAQYFKLTTELHQAFIFLGRMHG
jgi:hypothetical protein